MSNNAPQSLLHAVPPAANPPTTHVIFVQSGYEGYTTNSTRGFVSSCTYSAEVAARRQAEKLCGPSLIGVAEEKLGNRFTLKFIATADPLMHAFCWANGRIQIADAVPDGALPVATGPHRALFAELLASAQKGDGEAADWLLAPGVADAGDSITAVDALSLWLDLRARQFNGSKQCFGVQYHVRAKQAARAAA